MEFVKNTIFSYLQKEEYSLKALFIWQNSSWYIVIFFHGQLRNISLNIFSGRGRVMRVKPGEKYVTGSCFNKTSKKNIMIFYTKLKPIRTGWSWSSGSEDLEIGVSLRGPVLDFSREIKMPSFEVPEHILSSSDWNFCLSSKPAHL